MVTLKTTAAPGSAREITARTIERLLLDGRGDVEIDRQACPNRAASIRKPNHVKTSGKA